MKKLMIAGVSAVVMMAGGIGGAFSYKEHFEKARPYKLEGIEPPNMNKASRAFVANHPAPNKYCFDGVVLLYDDLNEALIAGHFTKMACYESKAEKHPEADGICYVSEVFEKNLQSNMGCILAAINRDTNFDTGNLEEIEQSLRFLKRYTETRQKYADLETYKQLNR